MGRMWLGVLLFILCFAPLSSAVEYSCLSCFASCETTDVGSCDCETEERCRGRFCFQRVEVFPEEGLAGVHKGCTDEDTGALGCSYVSEKDSVRCRCEGDECTSRSVTTSVVPVAAARQSRCCACVEGQTGCELEDCTQTCPGDYCVYDLANEEQKCGAGRPQLMRFLRGVWDGGLLCAHISTDEAALSYGCVCQGDECNASFDVHTVEISERQNSTLNPAREQHYCYTLYETSSTPLTEAVFRRSGSCEGNMCYVRYQRRDVAVETVDYVDEEGRAQGQRRPQAALVQSYELIAGCLDLSDRTVPQNGCGSEWGQDSNDPHLTHCVCDTHMCNYWTQVFPEASDKYLSSFDEEFRGTSHYSPRVTARQDTTDLRSVSRACLPSTLSLPLLLPLFFLLLASPLSS